MCVTLKCDPLEADLLRQTYRDVEGQKMPGWNFVYVGGDVPEEELRRMIRPLREIALAKSEGMCSTLYSTTSSA